MARARRGAGRFEERGIVGALVVMVLLLALASPNFMTTGNLLSVVRQASTMAIIAIGTVFVLSAQDVDMSIGAIVGLVVIVAGLVLREGAPIPVAILAGLATGVLCGVVNATLSIALRIPTIIITLGTLGVFRGVGLMLTEGRPITEFPTDNWFFQIVGGNIGPVPTSIVAMVVVAVVSYVLYHRTLLGRRVCQVGSNPTGARLAGIHVDRVRLQALLIQGFMCAVAGLLTLAFLGSVDPGVGIGTELVIIAAAIIGGASLSGGSGSIVGAVVGALMIALVRNGLAILGVDANWQQVVTGSVIIAAVSLDYFIKRR